VRCPRCHGASEPGARSCRHCRAPLLLQDDPAPRTLDLALDLDRRRVRSAARRDEAREVEVHSASRCRRAAAWAVDVPVLAAACAPPVLLAWYALQGGQDLLATLVPTAAAFAALLGFAYATIGHAAMGATLGKLLLGLQVVGPDGERPGLARSAARAGLAVLGAAGLGLGVLMALFTRGGRSLHDLVADTVVVRAP
jgi:resuscitation-promoting factor RpfA